MFRKALTIAAIGITFAAIGAVKSEAQCDWVNYAIVNVGIYLPSGGTQSYGIYDYSDLYCQHHFDIFYVDTTKGIHGSANDKTGVRNVLTASGASYSGKMLVGKKWYNYSLSLDATTSTVSFQMSDPKTGAVAASNTGTVSGSIYLNP